LSIFLCREIALIDNGACYKNRKSSADIDGNTVFLILLTHRTFHPVTIKKRQNSNLKCGTNIPGQGNIFKKSHRLREEFKYENKNRATPEFDLATMLNDGLFSESSDSGCQRL
jgi:hypothetical protein